MLDSLFGVNLILWMGSTIPLPAPYDVSAALQSVEVTNDANGGDGFSMTFTLGKTGLGEYGLMQSGALDMFNRVIIGVMIGAMPSALIDGIITHHQITPSDQPGKSTLTVMGRDVSVMLDLEEKNVPYENQPDFLIVTRLIAGYAQFGLVPQVTPTTDVPIFLERIPRQNETDLKFIKKLAEKNGFVFYIEPLTFGVNTAYWGPENRLSLPQSAINVDLGSHTNVRGSLHFSNDGLAPVAASGTFIEPLTGMSLPIPQLPSLRIPPLAANAGEARRKVLMRDTANQNPVQAALSALSTASNAPQPVKGTGELDSIRYGGVLRARRLVGVRGAGFTYDGFYFVESVKHQIKKGEYTQSFTIKREGTGTLLPAVVP
jgi:hypothetical protein